MSTEVVETQTDAAPQAVMEPEATAAPETPDEQPVEQQQSKTFTQDEVDALITKRLQKEQRKWERKLNQQPIAPPKEVPPVDQFASVEDYAQALAERKAHELLQQQEAQRQQDALLETYREREDAAREKYDDFEAVALNPRLPITSVMAQTIQASDIGPDVAYYLGANPKEADRISRLPPILQAKEIGKIEVKLADNPPVKKTSNAPAPIKPVNARASGSPAYDTTDPRSVKTMSASEWIEADRQRQIKKLQAQYQR